MAFGDLLKTGKGGFVHDVVYYDKNEFWSHGNKEPFVTHWMPLPKRPTTITIEQANEITAGTGFTVTTEIQQ
jgi:hypothetical protein